MANIILDMPYKVNVDLFPNGAPQLQHFHRFYYVVQFILVQGNEPNEMRTTTKEKKGCNKRMQ